MDVSLFRRGRSRGRKVLRKESSRREQLLRNSSCVLALAGVNSVDVNKVRDRLIYETFTSLTSNNTKIIVSVSHTPSMFYLTSPILSDS